MARPTKYEDLENDFYSYPDSVTLGNLNLSEFLTKPNLIKAWGDFLKALGTHNYNARERYGTEVEIYRDKYDSEKQQDLESAKNRWDEMHGIYDVCVATGSMPENWQKHTLERWCKMEGKAIPWEEERA